MPLTATYVRYALDVEVRGSKDDALTTEILEITPTTSRRAFERHRRDQLDGYAGKARPILGVTAEFV